jgi:AhpD family alkylhydroperoxidase
MHFFLRRKTAKQMGAFQNLLMANEKSSALNSKTKELINVALSICAESRWRLTFHVKRALENGATQQEIIDAASLAITRYIEPALRFVIPLKYSLDKFDSLKKTTYELD